MLCAVLVAAGGWIIDRSWLDAVAYAAVFSLIMIGYQNTWANYFAPLAVSLLAYLLLRLKAIGFQGFGPPNIGTELSEAGTADDDPAVRVVRCRIDEDAAPEDEQHGCAVVRAEACEIVYTENIFHAAEGSQYELLWVVSDRLIAEQYPEHALPTPMGGESDDIRRAEPVADALRAAILQFWQRIKPPRPTRPGQEPEWSREHQEKAVREWVVAQAAVAMTEGRAPNWEGKKAA